MVISGERKLLEKLPDVVTLCTACTSPGRVSPDPATTCVKKYMTLFSLLPAISLLIKIQASYLKHKLSIFAPGVPEKMDTFEQKKNFFTLKNIPITSIFSGPLGA